MGLRPHETSPGPKNAPTERLRRILGRARPLVHLTRIAWNLILRGVLRVYNRLEIVGGERLPLNESFVVVANHASHFDTPVILAAFPLRMIHRTFPAAALDYFYTSVPKAAFSAVMMNAIPFDRKDNPEESLELCRRLLEEPGNVLVLFPEGTRSPNGEIGAFRPGVGLLVAGTGIPVVPCRLEGSFRAWPKGSWMPRPRRMRVRVGEPVLFADRKPGREVAIQIADQLREIVIALGDER